VVEFVEGAGAFFKDLTPQTKQRIRDYDLFRLYLFYAIVNLIVNNWKIKYLFIDKCQHENKITIRKKKKKKKKRWERIKEKKKKKE